jgi:hypothetical protein
MYDTDFPERYVVYGRDDHVTSAINRLSTKSALYGGRPGSRSPTFAATYQLQRIA